MYLLDLYLGPTIQPRPSNDGEDGGDGDYDDYDVDKQTHYKTSRFRNVATLFIFATWTLGDCVAPEKK